MTAPPPAAQVSARIARRRHRTQRQIRFCDRAIAAAEMLRPVVPARLRHRVAGRLLARRELAAQSLEQPAAETAGILRPTSRRRAIWRIECRRTAEPHAGGGPQAGRHGGTGPVPASRRHGINESGCGTGRAAKEPPPPNRPARNPPTARRRMTATATAAEPRHWRDCPVPAHECHYCGEINEGARRAAADTERCARCGTRRPSTATIRPRAAPGYARPNDRHDHGASCGCGLKTRRASVGRRNYRPGWRPSVAGNAGT